MRLKLFLGVLGLLLVSGRSLVSAQGTVEKVVIKPSQNLLIVNKPDTRNFYQKYMLIEKSKAIPSSTTLGKEELSTNTVIKKETKKESSVAENMYGWVKDKYAMIMDVMPNQITNVMLYKFIDEWYGVRYRMGGTSKKGIDCSAFVQNLYKYVFGTDLLRTAGLQFQSAIFIKDKSDLKEGDLVFFRVGTSRISHVGVYLNNNYFVHSASSKGVSIAKLTSAYWSKYFAGGGRIVD